MSLQKNNIVTSKLEIRLWTLLDPLGNLWQGLDHSLEFAIAG